MWRIFYPLRYFLLRNAEKRVLDFLPSPIIAAFITALFGVLPKANFFHSGGALDKLLALTSALTDFYIAALVAVSALPNPDLDKKIVVGSITIADRNEAGGRYLRLLTRREFACTIFGYLSFLALSFSIGAALAIPISESNPLSRLHSLHVDVRIFGVATFSLVLSHLVVTTCLGLYYLMRRVNYREPRVISEKDAA